MSTCSVSRASPAAGRWPRVRGTRDRRAFFLGDPAASRTATLQAGRAIRGADAGHAAVYFPRLRVPDPLHPSSTRLCGPVASVAGLIARTDRERGVWKVPAGTGARLVGAVGLGSAIVRPHRGDPPSSRHQRHPRGPGHGIVAWEARTVGGEAGEWRYIPVRRMVLFIEQSLYRGLEWTVFEPNDEPTWTLVRRQVGAFLQQLYQAGRVRGAIAGGVLLHPLRRGHDDAGRS